MKRLLSWLRPPVTTRRTPVKKARPSFRLQVEGLEQREVLSTVSAVSWRQGDLYPSAVYVIGGDRGVYHHTGSTFGDYTNLGGYVTDIS